MKTNGRFKVTKFKNPSGATVFRVDGYKAELQPNGKPERVRKNFKTEAEAEAEREKLEIEALNKSAGVSVQVTRLSAAQIGEAEMAFDALKGKSMTAAIRFFLENYQEPVNPKWLDDALAEFLAAKEKANRRGATIRNLRVRVTRFLKSHPGKRVSEILPDHVHAHVFRAGSPINQANDRRALSCFFSWAMKRRYCAANPIERVDIPAIDDSRPQILTTADARKLMEAARTYKDGALMPYVALGLFAGLRPTELARVTWDKINLEKECIMLDGAETKTRQLRAVEMVALTVKEKGGRERRLPSNLAEWLVPHAARRTPIVGANWRRDFDMIKKLAGFGAQSGKADEELKPWVQDCMRHTAISNHLAHSDHEGKTAIWAGNSPSVVQKHYKALVGKEAADEFWNIRPSDAKRKIVKFKAA